MAVSSDGLPEIWRRLLLNLSPADYEANRISSLKALWRMLDPEPGEIVELQALQVPHSNGWLANKFAHARDQDEFVALACKADDAKYPPVGIYVLGNIVNPAVATRAEPGAWHLSKKGASTTDDDIKFVRQIFLDFDPKRPSGTSSTSTEQAAAFAAAHKGYELLADLLGTAGALSVGSSGNGATVLVAVEPTEPTKELATRLREFNREMKVLLDSDTVDVDSKTNDPKRLGPAFGTRKRKGVSGHPERPHRQTALLVPETLCRVSHRDLAKLLAALKTKQSSTSLQVSMSSGTIDSELAERARNYLSKLPAAICGEHGHRATWNAAQALVKGFGLGDEAAVAVLVNEFNPRCRPPWSEEELRRKVSEVSQKSRLPTGYLLGTELMPTGRVPKDLASTAQLGSEADEYDEDGRRRILGRQELAYESDDAEKALVEHSKVEIFSRGNLLVEVCGGAGESSIRHLDVSRLRDMISQVAVYGTWMVDKKQRRVFKRQLIPLHLAQTLDARGTWAFDELAAMVESPVLRPDGSILSSPGFDAATGLYLAPHDVVVDVPEAPSRTDAIKALEVLKDPFQDFVFSEPSKTNPTGLIVAAILTNVARHAIDGPCPGFAAIAPKQGSAKGLLVDSISLISTGRESPKTPAPKNEEEFRKKLLATAISGVPLMCIDNVRGQLSSGCLALAMTSSTFSDRLLGKSRLLTVPMKVVWFATGNGMSFDSDLARRFIPFYLDPGRSDPENRTGFRYPRLLREILSRRSELVTAALTVLRAYTCADRPAHPWSPFGSFESWDALIRGAVHWVGLGDACASRRRLHAEDDVEEEALVVALVAWFQAFGENAKTAGEVIASCSKGTAPSLRNAVLMFAPPPSGRDPDSRSLGYMLRKFKGRIAGGMKFVALDSKKSGSTLWKVVGSPEKSLGVEESGGSQRGGLVSLPPLPTAAKRPKGDR